MAQTGYTPILIYSSSTAAQAPSAGNLTNSTLGSELAINITDGKLFYKDNANNVQVIAWKTTPTTAGGTGLTSYTAGDLLYYASGTTLSKLAIGSSGQWLGSSGTAPQWNAPAALTKTDDTNVTLTLGGSASTALLNAASLTLGWTGQLATTRGGTGLSSFTANGVLYATSTSALTTGTALTFDSNTFGVASNVLAAVKANITSNAGNVARFQLESAVSNYAWYVADNANAVALYDYNAGAARISVDSVGNVAIGQGNLVIGTAGKGIDFSADSHAAGMTSELLDDYEEGTFTPIIIGYTTAGTATYIRQEGRYTKIGNQVIFSIDVIWNSGTGTGDLGISGLPFSTSSVTALKNFDVIGDGISLTAGSYLQGALASINTTSMFLYQSATGAANMSSVPYDAAGQLVVSGQYYV